MDDVIEIRFVGAENPRANRRRLMWTYHTGNALSIQLAVLSKLHVNGKGQT